MALSEATAQDSGGFSSFQSVVTATIEIIADDMQIASFEGLLDAVSAWFASYIAFNFSFTNEFKKSLVFRQRYTI